MTTKKITNARKCRKPRRTISEVLELPPPHLRAVAYKNRIEIYDKKWGRLVFYGPPGDGYTVLTAIHDALRQVSLDQWGAMEALQIDDDDPDSGARWDLMRLLRKNNSVEVKVCYPITGWFMSDTNTHIACGIERGLYAFARRYGRTSVRRAGGGERRYQTLLLTILSPPSPLWPPKLTALVS